jgi:hypothetical protein
MLGELEKHATSLNGPIPATSCTATPATGGTASRPVTTSNGINDREARAWRRFDPEAQAVLGNPNWQSTHCNGRDSNRPDGRTTLLRVTATGSKNGLDKPDGPPEPVSQVRVLPGAPL